MKNTFARLLHPIRTFAGTNGTWLAIWSPHGFYGLYFLPDTNRSGWEQPKYVGASWSNRRELKNAIAVYEKYQTVQGGTK